MAAWNDPDQQFIHNTVLGTPQDREVQTRRRQEGAGIDAAAVGRVESHRPTPLSGLEDFKRRVKLVGMHVHGLMKGRISLLRAPLPEGKPQSSLRQAADVVSIHLIFTKSTLYGKL